MLDFVLGGLEVEVVGEGVCLAGGVVQLDTQLELAPAVFGDTEGDFLEVCMMLERECWHRSGGAE